MTARTIRISDLQEIGCPVSCPPWPEATGCLKGAVWRIMHGGRLRAYPVPLEAGLDAHAGRIAFLMRNGWSDPIVLDLGVPGMPGWQQSWPIVDGNHRLAAAILAGHDTIQAEIGGSLDLADELFGDPISCPTH